MARTPCQAASGGRPKAAKAIWVCQRCTFANLHTATTCQMCDAPHQTSVTSVAPSEHKGRQKPTQVSSSATHMLLWGDSYVEHVELGDPASSSQPPSLPPPYSPQCTGVFQWRNIRNSGDDYVGDFVDGRMEGHGTYTAANGDVYTGMFQNNKMHGQGKLTYADGSMYQGQFEFGRRCGTGTYKYSHGSVYTGRWQADTMHGKGVLFHHGQRVEGVWCHGQLMPPPDAEAGDDNDGDSMDAWEAVDDDDTVERRRRRQQQQQQQQQSESGDGMSIPGTALSTVAYVASAAYKTAASVTASVVSQTASALGLSSPSPGVNKLRVTQRQRRLDEEARIKREKEEAERHRIAELERIRREALEAEKRQEEEQKRKQAEARARAEALERARLAELEQQRKEEEALKRAVEEERRKREEEIRRRREELEAQRRAEEERRRVAEEEKKRLEDAETERRAAEERIRREAAEEQKKREPVVEYRALLNILKGGDRGAHLKECIARSQRTLSVKDQTRVLHEVGITKEQLETWLNEQPPLPAAAAGGDSDEEDECVHCLERPKSFLIVPCGHVCLCSVCQELYVNSTCPVCRGQVERVQKVFL